jgi:hypothetical protein
MWYNGRQFVSRIYGCFSQDVVLGCCVVLYSRTIGIQVNKVKFLLRFQMQQTTLDVNQIAQEVCLFLL